MEHTQIASELRALEKRASEYESAIRQARAALTALFHADMPWNETDETARGTLDQPDTTRLLLGLVAERLARLDGPDELELSSKFANLAYRLENAGGARG